MKNIAVWLILGSLVVAVILFAIVGSLSVEKQEELPVEEEVTQTVKSGQEHAETMEEKAAEVESAPEEKVKTQEEPTAAPHGKC